MTTDATPGQPWTAPVVERTDYPLVADERPALENFLDSYRETLLWKCAGLTADQLKQRAVPPSSMTLLGLVRHMTEVERIWFRERVSGEVTQPPYKTAENWDADFDGIEDADAEADFGRYYREVEAARRFAAGRSLEETFPWVRRTGEHLTFDLRWLLLHMIEEYARHLGHADLLRERIDGATGA